MEEDIRLHREVVRRLRTYSWWDKQGGLKVFGERPRPFAWKGDNEDAPGLFKVALETVFWDYRLGERRALKDQRETIQRIAQNRWDGRPAYGGKIGKELGEQAPGPRFRHLRESYKALCESVGEQNRAIENALEKWEQQVRTRLEKGAASQWVRVRTDKHRQQYLVYEIDKALECYTTLNQANRASHIHNLLALFEVPGVPGSDSIRRTLRRAKKGQTGKESF